MKALNEHISFLQKEIQSKDAIIKMLINDHSINNKMDIYIKILIQMIQMI